MSSPRAFAIDSFRGFELTEDGQYLTLNCNGTDRIDLHCSAMHELLAALSNAIGSSERIRHKKKNVKFAMPCEAWTLGKDAGGAPYLIFTFRLPGGAELSFQLHRSQAAHMTEVLALATGLARSDVSGFRLQ
ncbi:hypothetical protein RI103_36630 [Paraburkholderia sp. FT54]|jgi:hypothetical protein|uniref:hypothetical protein n=1 Tax=Paraburkholderia sp. FT54 TaxID=3074437 RepID=UPI0028773E7F|nr:hypothetical protein [Paraburkholderia sp. FT54]WNC94664.1 hypothetical protein RI103_36630 [Paraburkholderia sp. FT54]